METLRRDNIVIPQGTTWALQWPIEQTEGVLTTEGWTVRAQIRHTAHSAEVLHEWSTEKDNATITNDYIELRVSAEESSSWDWIYDNAVFDAEVTLANGEVVRLSQGSVTVSPQVTR